jgi:hypothetical protein
MLQDFLDFIFLNAVDDVRGRSGWCTFSKMLW